MVRIPAELKKKISRTDRWNRNPDHGVSGIQLIIEFRLTYFSTFKSWIRRSLSPLSSKLFVVFTRKEILTRCKGLQYNIYAIYTFSLYLIIETAPSQHDDYPAVGGALLNALRISFEHCWTDLFPLGILNSINVTSCWKYIANKTNCSKIPRHTF